MPATISTPDPRVTRLSPLDQAAISDHFLRLDASSRYARFGHGVSDGFLKQYAKRLLRLRGEIFGIFLTGELRAVAEIREILDDWPKTAEAALSVEQNWQGKGLGNTLMFHIVGEARSRGTDFIHMMFTRNNKRMKLLTAKCNGEFEYVNSEILCTINL